MPGEKHGTCEFPADAAGLRKSFGTDTTSIIVDMYISSKAATGNIVVGNYPDVKNIVVGKLPDLCEAFPNLTNVVLRGLRKMENFTMPAWLSKCAKLEALQLAKVNIVGKMVRALGARFAPGCGKARQRSAGFSSQTQLCLGAKPMSFRIAAPCALRTSWR